jgi:branched-chain amino acid aminotransferase
MTTIPSTIDLRPTTAPLSDAERQRRMESLGFGQIFTEHMVVVPYEEGHGWGRGVLEPYHGITLDPATSVLHYGQAIFEGFKAYRQSDGSVRTFRTERNALRFAASARRLAMPELPVERFLEANDVLIRHDHAWVPSRPGESLYLRPFMIGTDAQLGVRPSRRYLFVVIASPSGNYFPGGVKPVTVWLSEEFVRASPGGTGSAKFAGNYAASLLAQQNAKAEGCDQVVWLDAIHRKYIEEMGGMNIMFAYSKNGRTTLVTPELTGTLLPGVTRESLLVLAREMGFDAVERKITVDEWEADVRAGHMTEAFACGTAAVITPIGRVKSRHGEFTIHNGETGPVASRLRKALLDIQHGTAPDTHGWMRTVVSAP